MLLLASRTSDDEGPSAWTLPKKLEYRSVLPSALTFSNSTAPSQRESAFDVTGTPPPSIAIAEVLAPPMRSEKINASPAGLSLLMKLPGC